MKYKLLAIDIDGTLLGLDHQVEQKTLEAIAAATGAGLRICLATGRSYVETEPIWQRLPLSRPYEPLVLIGGAMVSEPDTGRTLYNKPIPRSLACGLSDALAERGYSAMAILDAWRCGTDYILASAGAESAMRDWFSKMDVKVFRVRRMCEADDLPLPLRISTVVEPEAADQLVLDLRRLFDGRLEIHSILAPNYGVTIVEAFAAGVSKLTGLNYVA